MYIHTSCKNPVFVRKTTEVIGGLSIVPGEIVLVGSVKLKSSTQNGKIEMFCAECNRNVASFEEVSALCMQCGTELSAGELFIPRNAGGHYCKTCCTEFYPDQSYVSVGNIIKKYLTR